MSDILVVLPPYTTNDCVIFAKNADKPPTEVQEVVYFKAADHKSGTRLHCTFIQIDQVSHTNAIVVSKPAWCWGAEMGANEYGVCIGNTAVWTKLCHPGDHEEKLIGCDFVRLGLERSHTAREALDVITNLLGVHGQGGLCCEDYNFGQWTYHNAFVIADCKEAWILETAGKMWVAKKVTTRFLAASSALTIGTDADLSSEDLGTFAQASGYWKPEDGPLDFAKVFSSAYEGISLSEKQCPENRLSCLKQSLEEASKEGKLEVSTIFDILRDERTSINFIGELQTVGSQVSVISPPSQPSCHWFTATPNPKYSTFKPFIFCENVSIGNWTVSPNTGEQPRVTFQTSVDRRHPLYKAHENMKVFLETESQAGDILKTTMRNLEQQCVKEVTDYLKNFKQTDLSEVRELFNDIAESEGKFYV